MRFVSFVRNRYQDAIVPTYLPMCLALTANNHDIKYNSVVQFYQSGNFIHSLATDGATNLTLHVYLLGITALSCDDYQSEG